MTDKPWPEVPLQNRELMVAVAREVLRQRRSEEPAVLRHDCEEWRWEGLGCQRCKTVVESSPELYAMAKLLRDAVLTGDDWCCEAIEAAAVKARDVIAKADGNEDPPA